MPHKKLLYGSAPNQRPAHVRGPASLLSTFLRTCRCAHHANNNRQWPLAEYTRSGAHSRILAARF